MISKEKILQDTLCLTDDGEFNSWMNDFPLTEVPTAMDKYAIAYLNAYHEFRKQYLKSIVDEKGLDHLHEQDISFNTLHLLFQQSLNNKA